MTNEEKARGLAIKSTIHLNDEGKEVYNALVEAALQEMAEWKDEQMIDFLHRILVQSNPAVIYNMITAKITAMKGE